MKVTIKYCNYKQFHHSKYYFHILLFCDFEMIAKKSFEISARISLEEFEKRLNVKLNIDERDEIDTLGGFIFFLLGRIPGRGEVVSYKKNIEFTIIEADTRRIKRILVTKK